MREHKGGGKMNEFDTGHRDQYDKPFIVGSKVEWIDSGGYICSSEIILKDGCMIGVESWERFILVKDFTTDFRVI